MAIKITKPASEQQFELGTSVTLEGTADSRITEVELWADNLWHFGSNPLSWGNWSCSYRFTGDGKRQIEARGLDRANHQGNYNEKLLVNFFTDYGGCYERGNVV
jgi:hypothetical protein